jgi:hypothetical protein
MYSHCNMCNISIYFCNIDIKHLQRTSKMSETFETYACNKRFQRSVIAVLDASAEVGGSCCTEVGRDAEVSGNAWIELAAATHGAHGGAEARRGHLGGGWTTAAAGGVTPSKGPAVGGAGLGVWATVLAGVWPA